MRVLACLFLTLCAALSLAQGSNLTLAWEKEWDGVIHNYDVAFDVKVDKNDNIYVLGLTTLSATEDRYIILKYDTNGNFKWSRMFGVTGIHQPFDVWPKLALDPAGYVYATATTKATYYGKEWVTVKYNPDGVNWYTNYFNDDWLSDDNDIPYDIMALPNGTCVVVGFGQNSPFGFGVVVRYSIYGDSISSQELFQGYSTTLTGVTADSKGDIYAVGDSYTGSDLMTTYKFAGSDLHLIWSQNEAADSNGMTADVAIDNSGHVVMLGRKTRADGGIAIYCVRRNTGDGSVSPANFFSYADNGTTGFTNQNLTPTALAIDPLDMAYAIGQGTIAATPSLFVGFAYPGGSFGGGGQYSTDNLGVHGADVVADRHGAGFYIGTIGHDTGLGTSEDWVIQRRRNGTGDATYYWRYPIDGQDYGTGIALDSKENVICVGHSQNGNVYDIVVLKLVQRPFALFDVYHAYKNKTLNVNAAQGVKANDIGSEQGNVIKAVDTTSGTLTLYDDGSFSYTPKAGFVGMDTFTYYVQKGGIQGEQTENRIYVHPDVVGMTLPATVVGGEAPESTGRIFLSDIDTGEGSYGTLTTNYPALVKFPNPAWYGGGGAGTNYVDFLFTTQSVSQDTTVTITASRGGSSFSKQTVLKPGGFAALYLSPRTLVGGDYGTGTVKITAPAPAGGLTINLSDNSNLISEPFSVTVPQGKIYASFTFNTAAVAANTTVSITASRGFVKSTVAELLTPPPALVSVAMNPATAYGGQDVTGYVKLDKAAPHSGTKVTLSDDKSVFVTPTDITVPYGATVATFLIKTGTVTAQVNGTVTGTLGGVSKSGPLTLLPSPQLQSLTVTSPVTGGSNAAGTVTLNKVAADAPVTLTVYDNSNACAVPSSVTVPKGAQSVNFTITTVAGSNATATISAYLLGVTKSASLVIKP